MESKKINQLATELAPDLSDLTIIGDPTTGISKKITLSQMASLFTGTVEEYANLAAFPLVGVADTIYIAKDTNVIYRWDSTSYVVLSPNIIASLVFNDANGFDGTISLVGSVATLTITTALTSGSVPFIGASGALTQDNSNLFFDDTNNRLGIATASPTTALDVFGSGIIGRLNATSTNNSFLGFASNGTNKWSAGNVQSDHRFRIFSEANSAELITILQTGEFGIGIANPTTKLHIDGAATALIANLDANVSVAKSISFRSDNSNRINLEVSGTESGSNAGANFFLRTYTDLGALIETPFSIVRSTGVTTIKSLTLTNALSVANGGTGATSFTAQQIIYGNGTNALASNSNFYWETANNRLWIDRNDSGNISMILKNAFLNQGSLLQFQKNISTTGVINGYIGYGGDSSNNFVINHGGSERLTISSTGLVGIGASTLTFRLDVETSSLSVSRFYSNATGKRNNILIQNSSNFNYGVIGVVSGTGLSNGDVYGLGYSASGSTAFTEVLNWTSTGNVGIGITPTFQSGITELAVGSSNTNPRISGIRDGANAFMIYSASGGTEVFERRNGELVLGTNNTGRVWITSGGMIGVGMSGYGDMRLVVRGAGTTSATFGLRIEDSSANVTFQVRNDGLIETGTRTGSPYNNTSGAAANMVVNSQGTLERSNPSSIRFKENVIDWDGNGLETILSLKPKTFTYKEDCYRYPDRQFLGLIAEEVAEVSSFLADFENEDKTGQVENVRYANIVVPLIKAIQEQQAQIEELKAKIK
jgi:hypothetical protein